MIPYNSIIDQTVDVFEGLFGGELEILRHQSTFSYEDAEDQDEDYRKAATLAAENWDAPFIVTTAVQFFDPFMQTSGESFESCTIWRTVFSFLTKLI